MAISKMVRFAVASVVLMVVVANAALVQAELVGDLIVENHSSECVKVYFNGEFIAEVHTGDNYRAHFHDLRPVTAVKVICEDGDLVKHLHWHGRRNQAYIHLD